MIWLYVCAWSVFDCEHYEQVFSNGGLSIPRETTDTFKSLRLLQNNLSISCFHFSVTLKDSDTSTHRVIWMTPYQYSTDICMYDCRGTKQSSPATALPMCWQAHVPMRKVNYKHLSSKTLLSWHHEMIGSGVLYDIYCYRLIRKGHWQTWYIINIVTPSKGQVIVRHS